MLYKMQSDARISVAYNSCQWKPLTKRSMTPPPPPFTSRQIRYLVLLLELQLYLIFHSNWFPFIHKQFNTFFLVEYLCRYVCVLMCVCALACVVRACVWVYHSVCAHARVCITFYLLKFGGKSLNKNWGVLPLETYQMLKRKNKYVERVYKSGLGAEREKAV